MADVRFTIQGDKELAQKLRKFGVSVLDLSDSMDESGRYLTRFFSGEVFASRGQVFGLSWPALNDNYAAFKARTFPGRPPLIRTGVMNRQFKHKSTNLTASLWNESEYFEFHQEGRGVPERVMMHVDEKRERSIVGFIAQDISGKMKAADV
ncbi:hypothetical protein [Arthrobacter sp. EpRS71]|uniref:hypothetical protein n=1 Tax=Arthrobacter sp. EpRS71 TaxID=1743141 RepID=UPI000746905F|nr:hypothetical protein [Arthrobacter sp. EpRS71]KUM39016.1 hypothetical protein AR689_07630 [Arthrobacter sp. EpRS71]